MCQLVMEASKHRTICSLGATPALLTTSVHETPGWIDAMASLRMKKNGNRHRKPCCQRMSHSALWHLPPILGTAPLKKGRSGEHQLSTPGQDLPSLGELMTYSPASELRACRNARPGEKGSLGAMGSTLKGVHARTPASCLNARHQPNGTEIPPQEAEDHGR